jgi:hypothetical protein
MILETAQLLSTAHRVLDGEQSTRIHNNRKQQVWSLRDGRDSILYKATHINHPSAVWVRNSKHNYYWLAELLLKLCEEYTYRYGKRHKVEQIGLADVLQAAPLNSPLLVKFAEPTPAMPDECVILGDSIASYRKYYNTKKRHIASWKGKINSRDIPYWYEENT